MTLQPSSEFARRTLFLILFVAAAASLTPDGAFASGRYCADGGISIDRPDLSPQEVARRCSDVADFWGWVPLTRGTRCTICEQSMVRSTNPPPLPPPQKTVPPPPPVPFPPGTPVLDAEYAAGTCSVPSAWYLIPIARPGSNCPSPYITGGYPPQGNSTLRDTTKRWCGICPGGLAIDRFKRCCN